MSIRAPDQRSKKLIVEANGEGLTFAVIAAGGSGSRYGGGVPKQFISINGRSPLRRSIELFLSVGRVDKVICIIPRGSEIEYQRTCCGLDSHKLLEPVIGGDSRSESVRIALAAIKKHSPEYVLIHDAVRCFCPADVVENVIDALEGGATAVVPAIPPTDSVRLHCLGIDRDIIRVIQTPQGFRYDVISRLHEKYKEHKFNDDASLCDADNIEVKMIDGHISNRKITYNSDVSSHLQRVGFGYDAHRFSKNSTRKLRLMGIDIADHPGLDGVSDADVGIHSVVDAILGALGRGSIGEHFQPDSDKWSEADSRIFLEYCRDLLTDCHSEIINIDTTIVCESPSIAAHSGKMKAEIARCLGVGEDAINVKGKTTEGMGFEGRKEGISAYSVASIVVV
ncbi:MAG: 2-C-methyl-D-erythritol 2,4-cyclodiphosphate synthase [Holosporales bacterium]|jgi:2-C-methyl-D-erythritol 4-phosphate cytidylyltransferase/2-C-methyl-D-erythritol 2,4-cyclodiphosphate synthase|nr:2-C-methyl-D-erythritol 2,4-cyclodiphosphate synthase [Holosporales bacterium]